MKEIILFGIPNCDVTRAAMKWLRHNEIEFRFHDYREVPVDDLHVRTWIAKKGITVILNRNSRTWKELPEEDRENAKDIDHAIGLIRKYPTLIKRPLLEINGTILTGFKEEEYYSFLK